MLQMINRAIDRFEIYSISIAFAVATLVLFANVVLRYVFDSGLIWALEFVQYLFAWVVLIGAAHGVKAGIHLGIDVLVVKLPPAWCRWVTILAVCCCIFFVAIVDYESIIYIVKIRAWGDLTQDLQIPQWIPYIAIPVGMTLMLYHFVFIAWQITTGQRRLIHENNVPKTIEELQQ